MVHAGPGSRLFTVIRRVWTGAYYDGFIHAGNLAYMTILALFPFFIVVAAIFSAIGEPSQRDASIDAFLTTVPPMVAKVIGPVAHDVVAARNGWLLWIGALVGLWTASSLVETIRDILHRAYGTPQTRAFWQYRLASTGLIIGSVLLLLISLSAQVVITAIEGIISALIPQAEGLFDELIYSRFVSALILFGSIELLFISLTPAAYQGRRYPKWPGALLVAVWWSAVTMLLPRVLRNFFTYDLTYGSLAGVMIALFFFWLVGLGMVVGAELNAALAETPEERAVLREAENRGEATQEGKQEGSE
ncbi:MAG: YihY/virulence factor BrkB family protein [Novosphingobium sp.]|nr:YihY/virulence factor BrkB family protein [Novosphingobium sp.]MCP5401916.1 YihY/virulence factor BrkB family protein [Novosphingobium sp.]